MIVPISDMRYEKIARASLEKVFDTRGRNRNLRGVEGSEGCRRNCTELF